MKTLLFVGLAGVLSTASGTANAAIDSVSQNDTRPLVDLSFASSTALANPAEGAKTMPPMGNRHKMKNMGNMRHMKNMGKTHHMKNMGGAQRMKNRHQGGSYVRQGRMGYGNGYRKPHRGFRLPQTFVRPSYFIGNFGYYGLSQPSVGYGWSRYYDDAVLTDRQGVVQDARYNVDWDRYNQGYDDGYRAGQATYDPGVFTGDDRVMSTPSAYNSNQPTYQGDWDGAYREDGSYQGEWQGTYRDADGRTYEGEYSGTFIGDGEMAPHWGSRSAEDSRSDRHADYPDDRGYDHQRSDELAYLEQCKKSSGIGGAIVGGAVGAFAGNRIAGRGNRLGGSLIGGGLGAVAGAAIEQGTDRCRKLLKQYGYEEQRADRHAERPPVRHHYQPQPQPRAVYPSGWHGQYGQAYYYPQPQPMVTTIVVHSVPVTTTTTTTYIEEEVVYSKPTYKKRWKPAPKKTWKPATKAVPLKGCQQARCMYD